MPMSQSFKERLFPALPEIIAKFGSPFHIYDELGIQMTVRRLIAAFRNYGVNFKEYFAVKALPNPTILSILHREGCGFDCSSIPELRLARQAGASWEEIMFTSNNTSPAEFAEARSDGGCIINLDDEIFIDKLNPLPRLVCFRLNPGNRKTGDQVNSIIGNPHESKYGVPIKNIARAYVRAMNKVEMQREIPRFGLHVMVCSNDRDYTHMVHTVSLLLEVIGGMYDSHGMKFDFINMGGGVGIPYLPGESEFDIGGLARESRILVDRFSSEYGYTPRLCMESGRYITGPHGVFVNRVINTYSKYKDFIGVETAMPGIMRVGMYSTAYHHATILKPDGQPRKGINIEQTIAGSICENCDVLGRDIPLPQPEEGDIVVSHDSGAHGSAMAFNYNGRTRPQELLLGADGVIRRITRAETVEDLFRRYQDLTGPEHVLELEG